MQTPAQCLYLPNGVLNPSFGRRTIYVKPSEPFTLWLQHIHTDWGPYWQCTIEGASVERPEAFGQTPRSAVMLWRAANDQLKTHFIIRFGFPTGKRVVASPLTELR
jgi:hypothetical protein